MHRVIVTVLAAAVLAAAAPASGGAAGVHAPPLLTPQVAIEVGDACPGTIMHAAALVRGMTRAEAVAAEPAFSACAAADRLPGFRWKNTAANVALAAVQLTRALIDHDTVLLAHVADATAELRGQTAATDEQIRSWTSIPDYFDSVLKRPVDVQYLTIDPNNAANPRETMLIGPWIADAAYMNLAARSGEAWITTPRSVGARQLGSAQPAYRVPILPTAQSRPDPAINREPH